MSKINKFANLYDKDGNLLRKVGSTGVLQDYTVEELGQLVDKLSADKDENGRVKDPESLNNVNRVLIAEYQKPKNAEKLRAKFEKLKNNKTTQEQINKALNDLREELKNDTEAGEDIKNEVPQSTTGDNENNTNRESGDDEAIDRGIGDVHEEDTRSEDRILDEKPTVMEEYVPFEEV